MERQQKWREQNPSAPVRSCEARDAPAHHNNIQEVIALRGLGMWNVRSH